VLLVALNFRDDAQEVELAFPQAGRWTDVIDAGGPHAIALDIAQPGERRRVRVPSNYGVMLVRE
jgi:hypothetical protein